MSNPYDAWFRRRRRLRRRLLAVELLAALGFIVLTWQFALIERHKASLACYLAAIAVSAKAGMTARGLRRMRQDY